MRVPTVLVVEDEKLVALDIAQSLTRLGYEVLGPVSTAEEAIRLAETSDPDLVLMDIVLNGAPDGVTTAAHLSDAHGIPVLFLTAHADAATLERAKVVEPRGYIVKPFDERELHAALEMALYSRRGAREARRPGWRSSVAHELKRFEMLEDTREFLRSIDFFSDWEQRELDSFAKACTSISLRPGAKLQEIEGHGIPAFLVTSGRMAIIESSGLEKQLIVALVPPGDIFGVANALRRPPGKMLARAERKSDLLIIPQKTMSLLFESSSRLSRRLAEYLSERLRESYDMARAIAYDDVKTRISSVLLSLVPHFGRREPETGQIIVDITRNELARLTGSSIETVVRVLKGMEREGLVGLGGRKQILLPRPELLLTPRESYQIPARPDVAHTADTQSRVL